MKQYLVMIGLLFCLSLGIAPANADQNKASVYERALQRMSGSVLQVTTSDYSAIPQPPFERRQTLGTGSGFVVFSNEKMTIVVTAKHVVDMDDRTTGILKYSVKVGKKRYEAVYASRATDMDAAYLLFEPALPGVKALDMNLSGSDAVTEALAFGFGQSTHLKGQPQRYTFTHGYISRKVCPSAVFGRENALNKNVIYGTPTIIFGYSGGPVVDTDFRVLGINVAITGQTNIFVDIRAVYNWMSYRFGIVAKVHVPYDPAFEIFNRPGKIRLPIGNERKATIESSRGKTTLGALRIQMQAEAAKEIKQIGPFRSQSALDPIAYQWVEFGTLITIGDKHYKVRRAMIAANPVVTFRYVNDFAGHDNMYIYMCDEGWEVVIGIVEITDPEEVKERRNLNKATKERREAAAAKKAEAEKAKREKKLKAVK